MVQEDPQSPNLVVEAASSIVFIVSLQSSLSPLSLLFRLPYLNAAHFDGFPLSSQALLWDVRKYSIHWHPWQPSQPMQ